MLERLTNSEEFNIQELGTDLSTKLEARKKHFDPERDILESDWEAFATEMKADYRREGPDSVQRVTQLALTEAEFGRTPSIDEQEWQLLRSMMNNYLQADVLDKLLSLEVLFRLAGKQDQIVQHLINRIPHEKAVQAAKHSLETQKVDHLILYGYLVDLGQPIRLPSNGRELFNNLLTHFRDKQMWGSVTAVAYYMKKLQLDPYISEEDWLNIRTLIPKLRSQGRWISLAYQFRYLNELAKLEAEPDPTTPPLPEERNF